MNYAVMTIIEDVPAIIIYPKSHGTHKHTDIPGITELETGVSTCVRYDNESSPRPEDVSLWLMMKVQEILGAIIVARSWKKNMIIIDRILSPVQPVSPTS